MNTDKLTFVIIPVLIIAGAFAFNTFSLSEATETETIDTETTEQTTTPETTETIPEGVAEFNMTGGFQPQTKPTGNMNPMNMTESFNLRDKTGFNATEGLIPPEGGFNQTGGFPTGMGDFQPQDMNTNPLMEFITGVQRIATEEETTASVLDLVDETRESLNSSTFDESMLEQLETILDTVEDMVEDGSTVTDILNYVSELIPTAPN